MIKLPTYIVQKISNQYNVSKSEVNAIYESWWKYIIDGIKNKDDRYLIPHIGTIKFNDKRYKHYEEFKDKNTDVSK